MDGFGLQLESVFDYCFRKLDFRVSMVIVEGYLGVIEILG